MRVWPVLVLGASCSAVGCGSPPVDPAVTCGWDDAVYEGVNAALDGWEQALSSIVDEAIGGSGDRDVVPINEDRSDSEYSQGCVDRHLVSGGARLRMVVVDDAESRSRQLRRDSYPAILASGYGEREVYPERFESAGGVDGATLFCETTFTILDRHWCTRGVMVRQWDDCPPLVVEVDAGLPLGNQDTAPRLLEATDLVRAYVDETLDVCDDFDAPIEIFELIT